MATVAWANRPIFNLRRLVEQLGSPTAQELAKMCGLNRKAIHNRLVRGVSWAEADEIAVRCGFMPWEIWPEWEQVDPSLWLTPICPTHGNDQLEDLPDLSQRCGACVEVAVVAA